MKRVLESIRDRWQTYLEKLSQSNEKTFGAGPLNCCDLNRGADEHKPRHDGQERTV